MAPVPAVETFSRADVERDLRLEARPTTVAAYEAEMNPRLQMVLSNHSRSRTYPIVLPDDGSEMGWREPHTAVTLERREPDGSWVDASDQRRGARCGNYAVDWAADVRELGPGQEITMPWFEIPSAAIGDASRIRITARYLYGESSRDQSKVPPALHSMPEYTLSAAPLELPIARPYELVVTQKGGLPAGERQTLMGALDVVVKNRHTEPMPFSTSETGGQLFFEIEGTDPDNPELLLVDTEPTYAATELLAPGASRSLIGPRTKTERSWPSTGMAGKRLRAVWRVWWNDGHGENDNLRATRSAWVTLH